MLPFTKRPGRGDESGENDVVTKDDLVTSAITAPPVSKRSVPPPAAASSSGSTRGKFASINDEEMTTLMPTKSLGNAVSNALASPRPAAGAPPPSLRSGTPSSRPGTIPPSRGSSANRSGKFAAMEEEEEDGRTVVRGAPKIVKRGPPSSAAGAGKMGMPTSPTTISPAAVIKATLESARAGVKRTGEHLIAGPPQDLLEDLADRVGEPHPADVGAEHTQILQSPSSSQSGGYASPPMVQGVKALSTQMMQPQPLPHGTIPPGSSRPLTNPPPPMSQGGQANQSGPYNAQQSGGYPAMYNNGVPSGSVSVPGVAMPASLPAHFMVPQAPYSDGRMDPPGTAVTQRGRATGRPAMSWAMALGAFGIFVGVGAAAVMHGNDDGLLQTSASFVDPSRAAPKAGAQGGQATPAPAPADPASGASPAAVPGSTDPVVAAPVVTTPGVAVPAVAVPGVAVPAVAVPGVAVPGVAVPGGAAAAAPAAASAASGAATAGGTGPAVAAKQPVAAATARPAITRPVRQQPQAASDEAPAAPAPVAAKPPKGGSASAAPAKPEMDEETKKALQELQKAQLERSLQ